MIKSDYTISQDDLGRLVCSYFGHSFIKRKRWDKDQNKYVEYEFCKRCYHEKTILDYIDESRKRDKYVAQL